MTKIDKNIIKPVVFMTGGTSGFGRINALELAVSGSHVILLARNKNKAKALLDEFQSNQNSSKGKITIIEGNLNSLASVETAINKIKTSFPVIDYLVLNAGIMNFEYAETEDGLEETFQVNLVSPIYICHLLLPNLKKSKSAKIILTASGLHQGTINFDNLFFKNNFSSFKVYRQSKLGVILMCRLLAKPLNDLQIGIYSQHPGMVRTELGARANWLSRLIFYLLGSSAEKGSRTLSFLLNSNKSDLHSGAYYSKKEVTTSSKESYNMDTAAQLQKQICYYLEKRDIDKSIILS